MFNSSLTIIATPERGVTTLIFTWQRHVTAGLIFKDVDASNRCINRFI